MNWPEFGAKFERARLDLLDRYVAELLVWNKAIRLVGPKDAQGIRLQVVDAVEPFLYAHPTFPLVDIGSGAGLPAIPLAILYTGQKVLCVEPRQKRTAFLRHVVRDLGLKDVEVFEGRADEAIEQAPAYRNSFACATARAVSSVDELLSWAGPFLANEGEVVLGRGGEEPPPVEGFKLVKSTTYEGALRQSRSVLVYKRHP